MSNTSWTPGDIPNQTGRRAIVTGANSGIGFYTVLELARHGAEVVMTARDAAKGAEAERRVLAELPSANVSVVPLDLASLASVAAFAESEQDQPLDLLINSAGVMAPPKRKETADGLELQFGTNVAGHFALTAHLLPTLTRTGATSAVPPRIVTIASIAHKRGKLKIDDLQSKQRYSPMEAYQQSKLADLMFALELDRRLRAAGSPIRSIAAHPGIANTNLFQTGDYNPIERTMRKAASVLIGALLNTQAEGAIPTLYAATAAEAVGGGYYGPQSLWETRGGDAGPAMIAPRARDVGDATRLWTACEQLTGKKFRV